MSTRDLLATIATEMKKDPATFEKFITILEDEFLDTADSLKDVSDDQWKDMGIPVGLVNKIKDHILPQKKPATQAPA